MTVVGPGDDVYAPAPLNGTPGTRGGNTRSRATFFTHPGPPVVEGEEEREEGEVRQGERKEEEGRGRRNRKREEEGEEKGKRKEGKEGRGKGEEEGEG